MSYCSKMPTGQRQYLSMEIWLTQEEKRGQREERLNQGRSQVLMSDSLNGTSPFTDQAHFLLWCGPFMSRVVSLVGSS